MSMVQYTGILAFREGKNLNIPIRVFGSHSLWVQVTFCFSDWSLFCRFAPIRNKPFACALRNDKERKFLIQALAWRGIAQEQ